MYKAETTIPAAFEAVSETYFDLDRHVRQKCRERFSDYRLMTRMVRDIDQVLSFGKDTDEEPICFLWDDVLESVEGGKNWADREG